MFYGRGGDGWNCSGEFPGCNGENLRRSAQPLVGDDDRGARRQTERARQFFDRGGARNDADTAVAGGETRQDGLDGKDQE